MPKKRKSEATALDDVEKTLFASFCTAANSLSHLYQQAQNQNKKAFRAGERHSLLRLQQWLTPVDQQASCGSSVISREQLLDFIQGELERLDEGWPSHFAGNGRVMLSSAGRRTAAAAAASASPTAASDHAFGSSLYASPTHTSAGGRGPNTAQAGTANHHSVLVSRLGEWNLRPGEGGRSIKSRTHSSSFAAAGAAGARGIGGRAAVPTAASQGWSGAGQDGLGCGGVGVGGGSSPLRSAASVTASQLREALAAGRSGLVARGISQMSASPAAADAAATAAAAAAVDGAEAATAETAARVPEEQQHGSVLGQQHKHQAGGPCLLLPGLGAMASATQSREASQSTTDDAEVGETSSSMDTGPK